MTVPRDGSGATWSPIAIVGIACRLPGADHPQALLDVVLGERVEVREVGPDRWSVPDFHDPEGKPGHTVSRWSGQIEAPFAFDADFFGIQPAEARHLDPQQRILLEEAWHCVEDSGIPLEDLRAAPTAVITGVASRDHLMVQLPWQEVSERTTFGGSDYMLANRVSHQLGLDGPSFSIDAACAGGLTAAHLGLQMLQRGEVDFALVGGVNINVSPWKFISYSLARMLSPTGRCHTFSRSADGFVSADGAAFLLLRRLKDALAAGDHVHGTIIGSAVNSAGPRHSLTSPTVEEQTEVMRAALRSGAVDPAGIEYLETHGTGTPIGDPIEVEAICRVYGSPKRPPLRLGGLKANIGHTEAAAGASGLVSLLNLMRAGTFPPNVAAQDLNPLLSLRGSVRIDRHASPWETSMAGVPRRGAVSSFGAGGSNAHMVVEAGADSAPDTEPMPAEGLPFLLSARTPKALRHLIDTWTTGRPPLDGLDLADACWTLATGREHMRHRIGLVVHDRSDLATVPHAHQPGPTVQVLVVRGRDEAPAPEASTVGREPPDRERTQWFIEQCAALDALLPCLPDDLGLRGDGDGRLAAAVAAGMLDAAEALLFLEGGAEPTLHPPRRAVDLGLAWPWADTTRVFPSELRPLLADLAAEHETLVAAVHDALELAKLNPRVARALAAASEQLRALGHTWWPAMGEELPHDVADVDLLVVGVACASASAGLRRRWMLTAAPGATIPLLDEVVAIVQAVGGDPTTVSTVMRGADDGLVLRVPAVGALPSVERARRDLAAATSPRPLLAHHAKAAVADGELTCPPTRDRAALQATLLDAWRRGTDVAWRRWLAPRKRVPLPTYPFQRVEYRTLGPTTREPANAATVARPTAVLARVVPRWRSAPPSAQTPTPTRVVVVDLDGGPTAGAVIDVAHARRVEAHHDAAWWERWFDAERRAGRWPDVVVVDALGGGRQPPLVSSPALTTVAIARAAVRAAPDLELRVVVLAGTDAPPGTSCLRGLAVTLRRESRHVRVTYVETDGRTSPGHLVASEVAAADAVPWARYRDGRRERFAPEIGDARLAPPPDLVGGYVLVSGGRGRVGSAVARHVAAGGCTAVTLGRRSPAVAEESVGRGSVLHVTADVTDRARLVEVVRDLDVRHGRLRGVIHCAADGRDELVRNVEPARIADTMRVKAGGALVLDEVTAAHQMDFFVLCSSAAATFGNPGQSVYAMANTWLDDFARRRDELTRNGDRHGRSVSVQWPWWADGTHSLAEDHPLVEAGALSPMSDATGMRLLDHAITSGDPVEMPVHGEPGAVNALLEPFEPVAAPEALSGTDPDVPESDDLAHAYVRTTLADLTETDPTAINLDLGPDGYGLDSIFVTVFNRRLNDDLGCRESTLVYESRTFGDVARRLAATYADGLVSWHRTRAAGPAEEGTPVADDPARDDPALDAPAADNSAADAPVTDAPVDPPAGAMVPSVSAPTPIAIVGMAARLPGAPTVDAFWDVLISGRSAISPVTRWTLPDADAPDSRTYCLTGGFIDRVEEFDPLFFSMSPAEARTTDPQERLLLQTAWHALEDAGLPPSALGDPTDDTARRVGVFVGATTQTFSLWGPEYWRRGSAVYPMSMPWTLGNRISYALDLRGPSETIDTACSSSSVALHHAVQSLRRGECDVALVGAVNLYLHPGKYAYLAHQKMVSPSGACHPFGAEADGFVPGEGVVCVVLRREQDAVRAGDRVRAVVRGAAVNHGGRVSGLTVPNPRAQAQVIAEALADAALGPHDVDVVETHGTGTVLGDPIEARGLATALLDGRGRPLALGAVKGHIGHLEGAAGLAALVKVVLQIERGWLAPTVGATPRNPAVEVAGPLLSVVDSAEPWPRRSPNAPRVAGISSFGAGGVNAHVLVSEPTTATVPTALAEGAGPVLVPLSAAAPEQLGELAAAVADWAGRERPDVRLLAQHLQQRREHLAERAAVVCADVDDLVEGLRAVAAGAQHGGVHRGRARRTAAGTAPQGPTRPEDLARSWVDGAATFPRTPAPFLPTPLYPFARERVELPPLPPEAAGTAVPSATDLMESTDVTDVTDDEWLARPTVELNAPAERSWATRLAPTSPVLDEHRVWGRAVLPAVATIELLRRACADTGVPVTWMRNVLFSQPVVVDTVRDLTVHLRHGRDGWTAEMRSTDAEGLGVATVVHASAEIRTGSPGGRGERSWADHHAESTQARRGGPDAVYDGLRERGLDLGPSYRRIVATERGSAAVTARVEGATRASATWWHPCVLDSCLQASSLLNGADELLLPYMVETVRVHAPGHGELTSEIVASGAGRGARRYDVGVHVSGQPVVDLVGLWVREFPASAVGTPVAEGAAARGTATGWRRLLPTWHDIEDTQRTHVVERVVVVGDGSDAESIASAFAARGARTDRVAAVGDWHHEVAALADGPFTDVVVVSDEPAAVPDLARHITATATAAAGNVRLLVVHVSAHLDPVYRGLASFVRTASAEISRLSSAVAHVETSTDVTAAVVRAVGQDWPGALLRLGASVEVAGWVEDQAAPGPTPLRSGGTYLVTGGHRGLGLVVTTHLVRQWDAHVVAVGRSPDASPELAALPADRVRYLRADVTVVPDVRAAIEAADGWTGRLDGVFHVAGVLRDEFAAAVSADAMGAVTAPKVAGLAAIATATADRDLPLLVCFSSLAAAVANPGQASYAFANGWMDALVADRDRGPGAAGCPGRNVSILWPYWQDGGMASGEGSLDLLARRHGILPLGTQDGITVLEDCLRQSATVVAVVPEGAVPGMVSTGPTEAAARRTAEPAPPPGDPGGGAGLLDAVHADLRRRVGDIAGLGPERVRIDADIADYGLDSLAFARLAAECNEDLDTDITPATMFEFTSIGELAEHIIEQFGPQVRRRLLPVESSAPGPADRPAAGDGALPAPLLTAAPIIDPVHEPAGDDQDAYAIVGMAGAMPGSANLSEFWEHLRSGADLVTEIPADRWDWRDVYDAEMSTPNTTNSKWGGFLPDIARFDHAFFGMSPREAALMDPQHRLFLETAYRAIEDAGHRPSELSRTRTGVFVGASSHDYFELVRDSGLPLEGYSTTGMFHSLTANRVSYYLDLHGPSFPIDAACSSSLVALRTAIESMRSGGCSFAVVGGVNLLISPTVYISFSRVGMLSPTGRCRTFDADADGYVRGEGVGAVVIRPLRDAVRDRDHIHAVIRGSAVNHGGKVNTLTTPSPRAQSDLVVAAVTEAGIRVDDLDYVEMHGTGTPLGDPIEVNGLTRALRTLREEQGCTGGADVVIGSVKSAVGHLEAAAGMAGLFKVLLALRHEVIPANLHLRRLNEQIRLHSTGLRIADSPVPWPRRAGRLRSAGVSSFGFGGVNAHVVLQEAPAAEPRSVSPTRRLVPLSAKDDRALRQRALDLRGAVEALVVRPVDHGLDGGGVREALRRVVADDLGCTDSDVPLDERWSDLGLSPAALRGVDALVASHGIDARCLAEVAEVGATGSPGSAELLLDLAFTLSCGREQMVCRVAFVVEDVPELLAALGAYLAGADSPAVLRSGAPRPPARDDLATAAQTWVDGGDLVRDDHDDAAARRLSLPAYPFGGRRHWYTSLLPAGPDTSTRAVAARLAPEHPRPRPAVERFVVSDPEVAEHRVAGVPTLPGVVHLGLVLRDRGMDGPGTLTDVVWSRAVTIENGSVDLALRTERIPEGVRFEVVDAHRAEVRHSSMTLREAPYSAPARVDFEAARGRCTATWSADMFYAALARAGLVYGPAFRGVEELFTGPDIAVSRVRSTWRDGLRELADPSVLDAALQTVAGLFTELVLTGGGTVMPFAAASCTVHGRVPASGWAVARRLDGDVEVLVVDDDGRPAVTIRGLRVRPVEPGPGARPTLPAQRASQPGDGGGGPRWFLPRWEATAAPATPSPARDGRALLVRVGSFGEPLAAHLRAACDELVVLDAGPGPCAVPEGTFDHIWVALGIDDVARAQCAAVDAFSSVRALLAASVVPACRAVTVVAGEAVAVDGGRPTHPADAAVLGLFRSFAHEFPQVRVRMVGIAGELDGTAFADVLTEPPSAEGTDVVFRRGRRYQRTLVPIAAPAVSGPVVRPGGRYLVVGGGGGIGRLLAEDIAAQGGHVTTTGRRPRDQAAAVQGPGTVTYRQVQATNSVAMRRLVLDLLDEGGIDGVVLSAMVLDDGILERLDEDRFAAVLSPKVDGTLSVLDALRGSRPGFVVALSSVQSFTGAAGQASYAAASRAQDALCLWARQASHLPVTVIGWGPWANIGAVADDDHVARLRHAGWHGINPQDGMTAMWRAIACGLRHVVLVDAEDRALAGSAFPADRLEEAAVEVLTRSAVPSVTVSAYRTSERLVAGLVRKVLDSTRVEDLPPARRRYAEVLSSMVEAVGEVAETSDTAGPLATRLALARAAAAALPAWLSGDVMTAEIHFGDDHGERIAAFYRSDPFGALGHGRVADLVVQAARRADCEGRPARVLEVGAGTGSTTVGVVTALRAAGLRFQYDVTDVSERILGRARAVVGDEQVRYFALDLAAGAGGDAEYDAVVAGNVLHVLDDVEGTVRDLASRLRAGGVLALSELVRPSVFHTLVFGMFDGWWPADPRGLRLAGSPLLDADTWANVCAAAGLRSARVHEVGPLDGPPLHAAVVATRGARVDGTRPLTGEADAPVTHDGARSPAAALAELVATGTRDEHEVRAFVERTLVDVVARTLATGHDEVDVRASFSALGVDSIVGVDLVREISTTFGLTLKTIIVFDYPSVTALADHLVSTYGAALATASRAAPGDQAPAAPDTAAPASAGAVATAPVLAPDLSPADCPSDRSTREVPPAVLWSSPDRPAGATRARAVVFDRPAREPAPRLGDVAVGPPGPGEVELEVVAFPVNFSDGLVGRGLYPFMPGFPVVPGVEVSGRVSRIGPGVRGLTPGDVVVALTRPEMGGQATSVVVEASFCVPLPEEVDAVAACGVAAPYLAMSAALDVAAPPAGGTVLVTGATGTNGLTLIDLARARGLRVIGAVGSDDKVAMLRDAGVDGVRHDRPALVEEVRGLTAGRGVDAVVNLLGGDVINAAVRTLAPEGCYVEAAVFSLQSATHVDLSHFTHNQRLVSLNGKKLFVDHPERRARYLRSLASDLATGAVTPRVAHVVPLGHVQDAYRLKADRALVGRVVVTITGADAEQDPRRSTEVQVGAARAPARIPGEDIAVVGMSARFAGARDVEELWTLLKTGGEVVGPVPPRRWPPQLVDPDLDRKDRTYCGVGHFLDDIDSFDAGFFGMSGKEAAQTDPQQRLFLQEAWRALEEAGLCHDRVVGQRVGVFVGAGQSGYEHRMNRSGAVREAQSFWGNDSSVLAARIAYHLDLHGPSIAVNTACSSSLVALHLACQSIRAGDCDSAVAGGVFLMLDEQYYVVASNATMIAPDGRCKTFSADADGFGPGEGVGVLVLRRLGDALADGDPVLGVIKGSAINQDGRTNGITAPSGLAQRDVLLRAWQAAGVHPRTIGLVEAHGTGTRLGDPIEVDALTTAFRTATDETGFCSLGSVKTNIGHTAAAAGVAGVVKVLLALRNETIPATRASRPVNPLIDFAASPFDVGDLARPWPRAADRPRRGTVSSFGFSGTNAHVVLEEAPRPAAAASAPPPAGPWVFPVSADDEELLALRLSALRDWLLRRDDLGERLPDVAFTLQCRRDHRASRSVVVASTWSQLLDGLAAVRPGAADVRAAAADDAVVTEFLAGRDVDFPARWRGAGRTIVLPAHPYRTERHWFPEDALWHGHESHLVQAEDRSPRERHPDGDPLTRPEAHPTSREEDEITSLLERFVAGECSEDDVISLIGDPR